MPLTILQIFWKTSNTQQCNFLYTNSHKFLPSKQYSIYFQEGTIHFNMPRQTGSVEVISSTQDQTYLFSYRWVILVVFDLVSVINFMQLLQFSIIANIVSK